MMEESTLKVVTETKAATKPEDDLVKPSLFVENSDPKTNKNTLTGNSPKLDDIKPKNAELEKPVESSA